MDQRVCLFTGASSGIGAHTVEFLAAEKGWRRLALVARRKEKLEEVAARCRAAGASDVLVLSLDMMSDDDCVAAVEKTVEHFGRLDAMVCNAGAAGPGNLKSVREMDISEFDFNFKINFKSCFVMTKAALPHLEKTKGSIVYVSSLTAQRVLAPQGISLYASAKAALIQFARHVANEEGKHGIRVNTIVPGYTITALVAGGTEDAGIKDMTRQAVSNIMPMGRAGEVADLATPIAFLISEENTYITGTELVVDGGVQWSMAQPDWSKMNF